MLYARVVLWVKEEETISDSRVILYRGDRNVDIEFTLKSVDYVVLFDEKSPAQLLSEIKPDVHTKGADYNEDTLPEAKIIKENGGRLEFIQFVQGKSTTATIQKINAQK